MDGCKKYLCKGCEEYLCKGGIFFKEINGRNKGVCPSVPARDFEIAPDFNVTFYILLPQQEMGTCKGNYELYYE